MRQKVPLRGLFLGGEIASGVTALQALCLLGVRVFEVRLMSEKPEHMNGRIFDPYTGRFLSADSHVTNPTNLQSYNRYSYCVNSPVLCIDPSGYDFWSDLKDDVVGAWHDVWHDSTARLIIGIAAAWVIGPGGLYGSTGVFASSYASAAAAGFAAGYISSQGNFQAALISAATATAFYGIGNQFTTAANQNAEELFSQVASSPTGSYSIQLVGSTGLTVGQLSAKIVEHGLVGGVGALAGGGKFGPGALAGGFGEVTSLGLGQSNIQNPAAQLVITSVAGGTASVVGGGKFANGAMTAAFVYMFNEAAHRLDGKLKFDKKIMKIVDNNKEAIDHYYEGEGETVTIGSKTRDALISNSDQQHRAERIRTGKTLSLSGNYSVDMTDTMYHVGRTRVDYNTVCSSNSCTTTYTAFQNDGFWDARNLSIFNSGGDGLGSKYELGGTPYRYAPFTWQERFKNPYE